MKRKINTLPSITKNPFKRNKEIIENNSEATVFPCPLIQRLMMS